MRSPRHAPDGPGHVMVTHAHGDHASGAVHLADPLAGHTVFEVPMAGTRRQIRGAMAGACRRRRVAAGDGTLQVIHTPGHAPDHVCFWDELSRTLFCGDLVVLGSTVVIPAIDGGQPVGLFTVAAARHGARSVAAAARARIGDRRSGGGDPEISRAPARPRDAGPVGARSRIADRRSDRRRIYLGLAPALVPMARESVLAHLQKLEHEGLARHAGDEWRAAN